MLRKNLFPNLTRPEISKLRGGGKHNFLYFVGILETSGSDVLTNVLRLKLLNQRSTQRSGMFPEGYEPLRGSYGTAKFCLKTMKIPVPRLKLISVGWPNPAAVPRIVMEHKPACVLDSGRSTEALKILETEAEDFEVRHRIRRHAAQSRDRLDIVLSLMSYSDAVPICPDSADRFEAYLGLRNLTFLRGLLELLDMPDSQPRPSELGLPQAA